MWIEKTKTKPTREKQLYLRRHKLLGDGHCTETIGDRMTFVDGGGERRTLDAVSVHIDQNTLCYIVGHKMIMDNDISSGGG